MKKILSLILCIALFSLCLDGLAEDNVSQQELQRDQEIHFTGMGDKELLTYIEDSIYEQLVTDLDSDEYFVENVEAVYVSKEYLTELTYNSQKNLFYGYNLSDLDKYFEGTRYVFTVGEDGQTTVIPMQVIEDKTFEKILTNVAIGTGVILVCVVVSSCTAGVGSLAAVHMIFAVGAKTAAACAASGTLISGITSAAIKYYETGDMREALRAAAIGGSEGYKWGAVSGAVTGMASETWGLYRATRLGKSVKDGLTMNQAATIQREAKLPLDFIKNFHSMKEYEIYKTAALSYEKIGGAWSFTRKIDLNSVITDKYGKTMTNAERILAGHSPVDPSGVPYELHHIGQMHNSPLAVLTKAEHMQGGNNKILHFRAESSVEHGTEWSEEVIKYWQNYLAKYGGMM